MTTKDALELARNIKYGPLPKTSDPLPSIDEAIELMHQERGDCGFNWLTGQEAERVLRSARKEKHQ